MHPRKLLPALLLAGASMSAHAATQPDRVVLPTGVVPSHYAVTITPDAAKMSFTGSVQIDLDVKQATRSIQFNAADLTFRKVSLSGTSETPSAVFDGVQETVTLSFKTPVSAGHHVLSIDYSGKINQHAAGLFALDYDTAQGSKRALFTQFENSDARRFLPSWDEPGIKSTYTLTAVVPSDQMTVANTPIAKTTQLKDGLARVEFATSPKMSSYLLFFCLGDFERISRKVHGVDIGIVVKRGDGPQAKYALDVASQLLPYYEDYFGVKYPLPKLDLIGGPGQSQFFGAMENWGAIFYFEKDLLIDPRISTQEDLRNVYVVIAHEMAHQWFGDLVTMEWWDDLWLNEGFASWMEYKATDHFHPEWGMWLDALNAKERALRVDARASTHPVVTPIRDVLQAGSAFDTITYSKGQSVIRMLEDYAGEDAFRDGVRAYIKAHAYGNTVSDDLWREMDKSMHQSVTQIAHDFILQPGVPLIAVSSAGDGLELTQRNFGADAASKSATSSWHVPVSAGTSWRGVVSADKPVKLPASVGEAPVVNTGQAGYFRTLYDPRSFDKLMPRFHSLSAADQMGLLNDSKSLGYAGYMPLSGFMQLTSLVQPDMDPVVLKQAVSGLDEMNTLYEGLPGQPAFKAYGRRLLKPFYAKLGWDAKAGESGNTGLLRGSVLEALADFDDMDVIDAARSRFAAYLKDPASLTGDQRKTVLAIVADHADAATWDQLHGLAKAATSNLEQRELYVLLGRAHNKDLAAKALALSVTDEPPVTTRAAMVAAVSEYYPELAVDFFSSHTVVFDKLLEPDSRSRFVPKLASSAMSTAVFPLLDDYAAKHIPETARGEVTKAKDIVNENAAIRAERLPDVDKWLAANP